ncbi:MAG: SIS domain-containing protein [Acidobacteria bacterium]|nr:SIS domain-containing protein [Acidobacteriota bacterium]
MDAGDIRRLVAESVALKERFFAESAPLLLEVGAKMAESLSQGGRILAFGNGGSAADAQHLAGELVGHLRGERPALSALALSTDPSVLTAVANDMGYETIFRRQVEAHGRAGDVAIGITTSGRSPNVVQGLQAARDRGLLTVGLTGNGGGTLAGLVHHLIDVPHSDAQRIQEVHGMVVHVLCEIVEEAPGH